MYNHSIRTILISIILGAITLGVVVFLQNSYPRNFYPGYQTVDYKLQGKTYKLLLADNPAKQEKGLMFQTKLQGVDGMLFRFPDEDYRSFWNKNTYINLKIIWIDRGQIVGTSSLPSIEESKTTVTLNSPQKADTVLELPQ